MLTAIAQKLDRLSLIKITLLSCLLTLALVSAAAAASPPPTLPAAPHDIARPGMPYVTRSATPWRDIYRKQRAAAPAPAAQPTYAPPAYDTPATQPLSPSATPETPWSEKKKLFIAGAEIGGKGSAYGLVGVVAPLPVAGSEVGNGLVGRALVDGVTYQYTPGGVKTDARALGGQLAIGYMGSDEVGWWGVYAGPSYRYTKFSPDNRASEARGGRWGLDLQAEGERNFTRDFKLNANTAYQAFNSNAYWLRVRPLLRAYDNVYVGPEGIYQGDDDYKSWQLGAVVAGIPVGIGASINVKAGVRKTQGISLSPYAGVELGAEFR